MTVAYDTVKDTLPKAAITPPHEASDPFATPNGTPPDNRIPAFDLDDESANYHSQLMDHGEVTYTPGHVEPLKPFDGNRQLRRSQVIRKVNSGFEILRPGTLDVPRQSTDSAEWQEDGSGIKRQSRKLQKRGRATSFAIEEP